ncbi:Dabb family protein [Microbacterium fluvii]|uniref:Dabb family protein n=1 Tax=Microbacterium fluvii TaxID=415215 RepID=A0ABW2HFM0_9MICO|nr:Dabb family protein [Microbacterium fluvii]MCU4673388.1 Dabb family protein [Microbacterium fluvii]
MIRHIAAFQMAADDPAVRAEHAAEAARRLKALVGVVPALTNMVVGPNVLPLEGNWDLALTADFPNADALTAYSEHPAHREVVAYIASVRSGRAAIDIEL